MRAAFNKIVVCRDAEAKMRRRMLRALPNEHIEALWAKMEGRTLFIHVFAPFEHTATPSSIDYDEEEIHNQVGEAAAAGYHYVGTIHSHPSLTDTVYSTTDLRESLETPEDIIIGICAIEMPKGKRRKIRVDYWRVGHPMAIEYTDWSKT